MESLLLYSHDTTVLRNWGEAFADRPFKAAEPGQLFASLLQGAGEGVVLVDLAAPGADAEQLMRFCEDYPRLRFVATYDRFDAPTAVAMLEAGARGYCNRYARAEILAEVVRVVGAGEVWVGERLMSQLLQAFGAGRSEPAAEDPALASLTDREREVLPHVLRGAPNKVIARELDITERTVKAHVSSILHKLGVTDRMQLALRFRATDTVH